MFTSCSLETADCLSAERNVLSLLHQLNHCFRNIMTTISNQNSLNDPLARTKGGCANNDSTKNDPPPRKEVVEEGYDGVMPLLGIKQEFDEEIASVEADGMGEGGYHHSGGLSQGGNVEKKILTAALVNSMTEAPRSAIAQPSSEVNTNQRSVGTRSVERQAAKTEASISYPSGGASHVTPTTSEASSFSSVESADHESSAASSAQVCNPIPQLQNGAAQFHKAPNPLPSNSNSRTIYPRASKAAASTKVATAFNHTGGNSPRGKRKIDAVKTPAMQPTGKLIYRPQSQPINNSASASVPNPLADIATPCAKMPPPQPQVTFQYMQYPLSKSDPAASNSNGNNSFSGIAESMSSQKYQTDDLMSSSANELMSSQQQSQQGRGRIFSIDLDPSVLDFVESVVDPLGNSDDAPQGRSRNYSVTFDDDVNSNSGRLSFRRDRGFSFEFFSFGFDGDEPLPPIDENSSAVNTETNRGNRIRGDSIIFDPISFHDGGIHVTSALMHVDHVSQDNIQEYPASQPVAAAEAPQAHYKVQPSIIHHPPQVMRPPMPPHYNMQKAPQNPPSKPSRAKAKTDKPKRSKAKSSQNVHVPSTSSCRQITITTSSSSRNCPQSFSDNTIHMPHGSDAAAAAAAGMTPPSSTSSEGFGGISHTSCPMELLNKGGRIGIYLPEERKARIAKFHDKRKQRMWRKKIKYDCRKKLADSRPRIKGRFVKRSDVDGE